MIDYKKLYMRLILKLIAIPTVVILFWFILVATP